MTTSTIGASRSTVLAYAEQANGIFARMRDAIESRRVYRRTLEELRALPERQREDLGFAGADLRAVARAAARIN
jgi:uncharacterized protein YjiS (DUF1127 family)